MTHWRKRHLTMQGDWAGPTDDAFGQNHRIGWLVAALWLAIVTVPYSEATPTPPEIGGYWLCEWGGMRKCFFAEAGTT